MSENSVAATAYLTGETFSAAYRFEFRRQGPLQSRFDYIDNELRDKRVIHVECVDHVPLLQEKIRANLGVHGRITAAARECIGFDINREGIEVLRETYQSRKSVNSMHAAASRKAWRPRTGT